MAELLGILVEGLMALLSLLAELLVAYGHLLLEGLAVLACFLFSRRFRSAKLELWRAQPRRKIIDLSVAAAWLALILSVPLLLFWPRSPRGQSVSVHPASAQPEEDLRLELRLKPTNAPGVGLAGTVVVKKGGVGKILETRSLRELKTQLVENIKVLPRSTPASIAGPTNAANAASTTAPTNPANGTASSYP